MPRSRKCFLHIPATNQRWWPWFIWSGKQTGTGEQAGSWCICAVSPIQNEGSCTPGHMELYFADKVASNWQVMATFGDLFPRLPSGECRRNRLFSHQAATERPEDKQRPRDTAHGVWRASSMQRWFLHFQWGHFLALCCREPQRWTSILPVSAKQTSL